MSALSDALAAQALELPERERGKLVDQLVNSLHQSGDGSTPEDVKTAWVAECRRRMAETDAGEPGIPLVEAWPQIAGRHA